MMMFISRALFPTLVLLCLNDIGSDVKYFDGVRCDSSERVLKSEKSMKEPKEAKSMKGPKEAKALKSNKGYKQAKHAKKGEPTQETENVLKVMTRNIYLGADLNGIEDINDALGAVNFVASVLDLLENDTQFPVRAGLLADEILETKPDLIGIQEAATFVFTDPLGTETTLDYLTILLENLTTRGLSYSLAVKTDPVPYLPAFPSDFLGSSAAFRQADAILVNSDNTSLDIAAIESGIFTDQQMIATPLGEFPIINGWCYIDGVSKGKNFRFSNTHLNGDDTGALNTAQAQEFLDIVVSTTEFPTIVVGDMNTTPEPTDCVFDDPSETYNLMTENLKDAWEGDGGYTFGTNEKLTDADFYKRIDYIFYNTKLKMEDIAIVGREASRNSPPLFASDHAGLVASFALL